MSVFLDGALVVLPQSAGGPQITSLRLFRGRVIALGVSPRRGEKILDLQGFTLYPGLINAHDHLELNHFPRTKFQERYDNAHQWGEAFLPKLNEEPFCSLRALPLRERCRVGLLKNIRSGVTTVAQHNPLHRPLRQRYTAPQVIGRYGWAHSLHFTPPETVQAHFRQTPPNAPFMIHLAEGTDEVAAGELSRLQALGCLGSNTILIHGVGLSRDDQVQTLKAGAGLVWCPSSNHFLLGQTAHVEAFSAAGTLALGSDSRLTADGDLLDELRAAHATAQISPAALFKTVTTDAARMLRVPDRGALLPGYRADFWLIAGQPTDPYRNLIDLCPEDIQSVWIGGQKVYQNRAYSPVH